MHNATSGLGDRQDMAGHGRTWQDMAGHAILQPNCEVGEPSLPAALPKRRLPGINSNTSDGSLPVALRPPRFAHGSPSTAPWFLYKSLKNLKLFLFFFLQRSVSGPSVEGMLAMSHSQSLETRVVASSAEVDLRVRNLSHRRQPLAFLSLRLFA